MILAVDIGNRTVSFGLFAHACKDAEPLTVFRMAADARRTADEYAAMLAQILAHRAPDAAIGGVVIGSVCPALTPVLAEAFRLLYPAVRQLTLGAGLRTGLIIRTADPASLGADLVANAVGAASLLPPPFLLLDCGSAITLSCVEAQGESAVFLGCAILPGVTVSANALTREAAQLFDVALTAPRHAIGTDTAESVRAGILMGLAAAVDGLVTRMERELGKGALPIVATGADAALLLPFCTHRAALDENLTLKGLYRVAMCNEKLLYPAKRVEK